MKQIKKIMGIVMIIILLFPIGKVNSWADDTDTTSIETPVIRMKSVRLSKNKVKSGDTVTLKIEIANTSKNAEAKNMIVTAGIESEYIQLTDKSDRISLGQLKAGESGVVTYTVSTKSTTPSGIYDVNITMDYTDKDGNAYSGTDKAKVTVGQNVKVTFDSLIIDSEATVGETISAGVNAMNFGNSKLCNVRAIISGDGLKPKGTLYIGDIEPGQMGSGSVEILVSPMKKGASKYGVTKGKVTYYYENEFGKKKKVTKKFSIKIKKKDKNDNKKDQPKFQPKIIIDSYKISKKKVYAGEEFNIDITLRNTNESLEAKNMMVTAGIENEVLQLKSKSDSTYIDKIAAGAKKTVSYKLSSNAATPTGQYEFKVSMGYEDKEGNSYDSSGQVKVNISQKSKIKFDQLIIENEAEIGDTIEATVKAMNLGNEKLKNVRAEIKADGLKPSGTAFIGDIEAGQVGTASVEVSVNSMTEEEKGYGTTNGIVTYYYENGNGEEGKVEQEFTMNIKELSISSDNGQKKDGNQWWIAIVVIVLLLCGFAGYGIYRKVRKQSGE